MKNITAFVTMLCLCVFCFNENACALTKSTHSHINGTIIGNKVGFDLGVYLKNNLKINAGMDERFEWKKVIDHIKDGGRYEDEPLYTRSFNHFHDPLVTYWPDAGYKPPFPSMGEAKQSSIVWAEKEDQSTSFGNYSWPDARKYFYIALTAFGTDGERMRDYNYAQTFRSLGQLMHLVQDASVPAHVRNDGHVAFMYEDWIETFRAKDTATFDSILASPTLALSPTLTSRINYNADATIPIAGLFDTDTYTGSNPAITMAQDIGLAEYTNANFFSEQTAFKDYPYPALSSVAIEDFPVSTQNGGNTMRPYYYKSGEGDAGYPLATMGYLFYYSHKYMPDTYIALAEKARPAIDSTCYDAYARRLLPRAVAYSSELLRYFFRGDIEAIDASATHNSDNAITGMTMKVKNATPDEGMAGGDLVVSCRYKPDGETEFSDTKSDEVAMSALATGATSEGEYTFSFPDPIPSGARDKQYTLVYRGQLGAEADAVAGKAFKTKSLAIDDWERDGVLWTSEFAGASASLSEDDPIEGNKAMKIDIAQSDGEEKLYESIPQHKYYGSFGWGYGGVCDCMWMDETGQSLLNGAGRIVTRMTLYLCNFANSDAFGTTPYEATLKPRIYMDNGSVPGELFGEGDDRIIHDTDLPYLNDDFLEPINFTFTGGIYLPEDNSYNISAKSFNFTGVDTDDNVSIGTPKMSDAQPANAFSNDRRCCSSSTFTWYQKAEHSMPITIYAVSSKPIASREVQKDCSEKSDLKFAVKSSLTGNVVDFYYGTDAGYLTREPVSIASANAWQTVVIPFSEYIDKSQLKYYEFRLGKDSINYETGETRANVIYIDQLEAE